MTGVSWAGRGFGNRGKGSRRYHPVQSAGQGIDIRGTGSAGADHAAVVPSLGTGLGGILQKVARADPRSGSDSGPLQGEGAAAVVGFPVVIRFGSHGDHYLLIEATKIGRLFDLLRLQVGRDPVGDLAVP